MPSFDNPEDYQHYLESDLYGYRYEQSQYDKGESDDDSYREHQSDNNCSNNNWHNIPDSDYDDD